MRPGSRLPPESDALLASDVRTLPEEHASLAHVGFLEGSPALPEGPEAREGQAVGAYILESLIGRGGMGSVRLARRSDGRFEHAYLTIAVVESSIQVGGADVNNLSSQLVHRSQAEMRLGRHREATDEAGRAVDLPLRAAEPGNFSSTLGRAIPQHGLCSVSRGKPGNMGRLSV